MREKNQLSYAIYNKLRLMRKVHLLIFSWMNGEYKEK